MPRRLPIVRPFYIPALELWFTDKRHSTQDEWVQARDTITEVTMRLTSDQWGQRGWCDEDHNHQLRVWAEFERWQHDNPDGDYTAFKQQGGEQIDAVSMNHRLPALRLVARADGPFGEVRGGCLFYNLRVTFDGEHVLGIGGVSIVGLRSPNTELSVPATWGELAAYLYQNDLRTYGRRAPRIRCMEGDYPETVDSSLAPSDDRPELEEFWSRVSQHADSLVEEDGQTVRVRARRDRRPGDSSQPVRTRRRRRRDAVDPGHS